MNRIDRVTAILIQLQSRKIVKAQDIADRFTISLRTVYRDIRTLEEAGIPIHGEAGIGYSIMEGYRLPPVMFTREEAAALLTAEKLVEKLTDPSTQAEYKSAMYKIRAVLRTTEKDLLEDMEENIAVMRRSTPFASDSAGNLLPGILKSISDKEVLKIQYNAFHNNQVTERMIEPIGIFYSANYWHTIAFCRLRNDYRDFRADRILQLRPTGQRFDKQHPSLHTYLDQLVQQQNLQPITIRVKRSIIKYLEEAKFYYGFMEQKTIGTQVEMAFLSPDPATFVRWYCMFADAAEIIAPDTLRDQLRDYLKSIFEKNP